MRNNKSKISINICKPTMRGIGRTSPKDSWYIERCLGRYFDVQLEDDPDFLIFSDGGNKEHLLNTKAIRIFVTGENMKPNWEETDYALTHEREYNNRHWRLPLHRQWFDTTCTKPERDFDIIKGRVTRFCNFIYSNDKAQERIKFYQLLSQYKKVDSGGKVLNNIGGRVEDKLAMVSESKFTIAFENESYPGYSTEKIIQPLLQGSIPIYWGDPTIAEDFNPNCFINVHNYNSYEEVIDEIKKIDNDEMLWKKMVTEPIFKDNELPMELSDKAYKDFFSKIFSDHKVYITAKEKEKQKRIYLSELRKKQKAPFFLRLKNRFNLEKNQFLNEVDVHLKVYKKRILVDKLYNLSKNKNLIVSAGMQRSGSTFMFNILKELVNIKTNCDFSYAYIKDFDKVLRTKQAYVLIKTHETDKKFTSNAYLLVYTYRDVRTAMLSQYRKFNTPINYGFVKYCIGEYEKAKEQNAIMVKYEDLINNPEKIIMILSEKLSIDIDPKLICEKIINITNQKDSLYEETLLHENHRTGTTDFEWRENIDKILLDKINEDFRWWFKECGYPEQ
jgi:hypothetical protein